MRPQDVLAQQSYPAIAVGAALQLQRQQRPQPPGKEAEAGSRSVAGLPGVPPTTRRYQRHTHKD